MRPVSTLKKSKMKKFFWIAAFSAFARSGIAQEGQADTASLMRYCVEQRSGAVYVTHNGKEILTDIHLENGTIIHPDGLVETSDRLFRMRPNQCIRRDGRLEAGDEVPGSKGTAGK